MVGGPNFESVAEARVRHMLGADAVGKEPPWGQILYCGLRVFGLSLTTNKVVKEYDSKESANPEGVLEVSRLWAVPLQTLVTELPLQPKAQDRSLPTC
uniref:Uncharacterized protein n=1 Tax=Terrapene triunguis TaxID=2587831 RepID=A0A674J5X4_9SAUR